MQIKLKAFELTLENIKEMDEEYKTNLCNTGQNLVSSNSLEYDFNNNHINNKNNGNINTEDEKKDISTKLIKLKNDYKIIFDKYGNINNKNKNNNNIYSVIIDKEHLSDIKNKLSSLISIENIYTKRYDHEIKHLKSFSNMCSVNFKLSENNTILEGDNSTCGGRFAYGEFDLNGNGYTHGIQYWSVQTQRIHIGCYCSIGVTTKKNKHWIENNFDSGHWPTMAKPIYFYNVHSNNKWKKGDIMTVKLDCNQCKVTYFKNKIKQEEYDIPPNQMYYFALSACVTCNTFRVVACDNL